MQVVVNGEAAITVRKMNKEVDAMLGDLHTLPKSSGAEIHKAKMRRERDGYAVCEARVWRRCMHVPEHAQVPGAPPLWEAHTEGWIVNGERFTDEAAAQAKSKELRDAQEKAAKQRLAARNHGDGGD